MDWESNELDSNPCPTNGFLATWQVPLLIWGFIFLVCVYSFAKLPFLNKYLFCKSGRGLRSSSHNHLVSFPERSHIQVSLCSYLRRCSIFVVNIYSLGKVSQENLIISLMYTFLENLATYSKTQGTVFPLHLVFAQSSTWKRLFLDTKWEARSGIPFGRSNREGDLK